MSTPANIAELDQNGKLHIVNVAMDGDTSETGVGPRLNVAYNDPKKVRKLVSMGNLAHVGFTTDQANAFKEGGNDWARYAGVDKNFAGHGISKAQALQNQKNFDKRYSPVSNYTHAFNRDWGRKNGEDGVVADTDLKGNESPEEKMKKAVDSAPMAGDYTYLYDDNKRTWYEKGFNQPTVQLSGAIEPDVNAKVLTQNIDFTQNPINPDIPPLNDRQINRRLDNEFNPENKNGIQAKMNYYRDMTDHETDPVAKQRDKKLLHGVSKQADNLALIGRYSLQNPDLKLYPTDLGPNGQGGKKLQRLDYSRHPNKAVYNVLNQKPRYSNRLNVYTGGQALDKLENRNTRINAGMSSLSHMGIADVGKNILKNDSKMMDQIDATKIYSGNSFKGVGANYKTVKPMSFNDVKKAINTRDPYNEKLKSALHINHDRSRQIISHYPKYAKKMNIYTENHAKNYLQKNIQSNEALLNNPTADQKARIKEVGMSSKEVHDTVNHQITTDKKKLKSLRPGVYTGEAIKSMDYDPDFFKPLTRKTFNANVNDFGKHDPKLKTLNYASKSHYRTLNEMNDLIKNTARDPEGHKFSAGTYVSQRPELTKQFGIKGRPNDAEITEKNGKNSEYAYYQFDDLKGAMQDKRAEMVDNIADKKGFYRNDFGRRLNRRHTSQDHGVVGGKEAKAILNGKIDMTRDNALFDETASKNLPKYKAMYKAVNPFEAYNEYEIDTKKPDVNKVTALTKGGVKAGFHDYAVSQLRDDTKPHASADIVKDAKAHEKMFNEYDQGLSDQRSDAEMDAQYPHTEEFSNVDASMNYDMKQEIMPKHAKAYKYHRDVNTYHKNVAHNQTVINNERKDLAKEFPTENPQDTIKTLKKNADHKATNPYIYKKYVNAHGKKQSRDKSSLEARMAKTYKKNHESASHAKANHNQSRKNYMSGKRNVTVKSHENSISRNGLKKGDHGRE